MNRRYTTDPQQTLLSRNVVIRSNSLRAMFLKLVELVVQKIRFFFNNILEVRFLNLVFKVDQHKRVYFLYCRRLSTILPGLKEIKMFSELGNLEEHKVKDFVMNSTNLLKEKHKETDSQKEVVCVSCDKFSGTVVLQRKAEPLSDIV